MIEDAVSGKESGGLVMTCRRSCIGFALFVVVSIAMGCTQGPDGSTELQPLVFPWEAHLGSGGFGSSVAIVLDSNYIVGNDDLELYDLHRSEILVDVVDPDGIWTGAPALVRRVFPLHAAPYSWLSNSSEGAWVTVVLVDLPDESALSGIPAYPFTAQLSVSIDGVLDLEPRIVLMGNGGTPNPVIDASLGGFTTALEPRPMLRLRPKRLTGAFEPGMSTIGGVQFRAYYKDLCINNVVVLPGTEAARASVVVGEASEVGPLGYRNRRVVMVHPNGFSMNFLTENTDLTLAGEGPLLDIAVAWKATTDPQCDLADPSLIILQDLVVTGVSGDEIFSMPGVFEVDRVGTPSATAAFRGYPVDLPPPPPSGGC